MNSRPLRTADELRDIIIEQARVRFGSWPAGMTLFVFDDAYGWTASISRPASEADHFYRIRTFDLIEMLRKIYDLNILRLSDDLAGREWFASAFNFRCPQTSRESTWQRASKKAIGKPRSRKRRRSR
jgi:hypothetical protein